MDVYWFIPYALRKEESPGWIFAHHLQGTYSGCSVTPATHNHSSCVLEQVVWSKICSRARATTATQRQLHSAGRKVESNAWLASKSRWWVWKEYLGNLQKEYNSSGDQAIRNSLPSENTDTSCPAFETAAAKEDPSAVTKKRHLHMMEFSLVGSGVWVPRSTHLPQCNLHVQRAKNEPLA